MKITTLYQFKRLFAPRSLQYQLLSRSLLILSGLFILIGVFQWFFMSQFLYQNTARTIRNQVCAIPFQVWLDANKVGYGLHPPNPFSFSFPGATVSFIHQNGNFQDLFEQVNGHDAPRLPAQSYKDAFAFGQRDNQYQVVSDNSGNKKFVVLTPIGPPGEPIAVVQVSIDVGPLEHILMQQVFIFVGLAIFAIIAGVFTFIPTLRRTLIPLSKMVQSVSQVNAGNLDERISVKGTQTETELLARSFNAMLERLKVSFESEQLAKEKMRQFVADASHELRTPLTSIHGFLEVLLRGAAQNPNELKKALESMYSESERITKLVHHLLLLARLDEEPTLILKNDRLDIVVSEMEPQLRLLAGEREVQYEIAHEVFANFDKDRMKQVLLNLYQNAVHHTDPMVGRIFVSLAEDAQSVYLTVQDNGTGIPKEHLGRLFERFYRMDTDRSRKSGGAGLGLAITNSIIKSHGGDIICDSQFGKGATFTVRLPK